MVSYLQNRNRDTNVENKCMDTKGGKGRVGRVRRLGMIYTLLILCIKQITNENKPALWCNGQYTGLLAGLGVVIQRLWVQVPPESNFDGSSFTPIQIFLDFSGGSDSKASACRAGDLGSIPGFSLPGEDALEKEMATHSSILAWKIPRTEEPGRLQSMGSHHFHQ